MRNVSIIVLLLLSLVLGGCSNECAHRITDIGLSSPASNALKVQATVHTTDTLAMRIEYWLKGKESQLFTTTVSAHSLDHRLVLTNLRPEQQYGYRVVTTKNNCEARSKDYDFKTSGFPIWIKDFFTPIYPDSSVVPAVFKQGYLLIYRRETPGILFIIDHKGGIVWYHQVNGTGFKTAHFTQRNTILCILGNETYQTSYGNEILELSLNGDTVFHQRTPTIHHEILLNDRNQVVTISSEEKIVDLSARGGGKADTVKSDGIWVLDKNGKTIWKWTVFDALDPLTDKNIVKDRGDWMHANSLNIDKDGNYLISFYNNGQIWKVNAQTGKLMWKFGKGGDFKMPSEMVFDNSHAIHINRNGDLMLFDNGTSKQLSRTLAFRLDEPTRKASLALQVPLPRDVYSERMGSGYLVNDTTVLHTCSKKNTVVLSNLKGRFLWALRTGMSPYRVEFISKEKLEPFILNGE